MTKPISKSKRQLAQLLIEAGVTQFPAGANWAAQDGASDAFPRQICFFRDKPTISKGDTRWVDSENGISDIRVAPDTLIPNWHQTVLSRDEFGQIVAETVVRSEQDNDGWVEWKGGECPVSKGVMVDVRYRCGKENIGVAALLERDDKGFASGLTLGGILRSATDWRHDGHEMDIIAYRLHKSEQQLSELRDKVTE